MDTIKAKIEQVLQAEKEAERVIEKAHKQSEIILHDARDQIRTQSENLMTETEKIILDEQKKHQTETDRILREMELLSESETRTLHEIGKKNIPAGVSYILKSFME